MCFDAAERSIGCVHDELERFMSQLGYAPDSDDDPENPLYRAKLAVSELGANLIEQCEGKTMAVSLRGDSRRILVSIYAPLKYEFDPEEKAAETADMITARTGKEILEITEEKMISEAAAGREGSHPGFGCLYSFHYADSITAGPWENDGEDWTRVRILVMKKRKPKETTSSR